VIYSAHWDHLGKQGDSGDTIFNGAVDNASGSAGLLAMAQEAARHPARRSQMFLWVAAEEQGLLGSAAYAAKPLWPLDKDGGGPEPGQPELRRRRQDIGVQGSERSTLGAMAASRREGMQLTVAAARARPGRRLLPQRPLQLRQGRRAGVLGLGRRDWVKDKEANDAKQKAYGARYHQVDDEYDANWDLSGMVQQAQFTLNLGRMAFLHQHDGRYYFSFSTGWPGQIVYATATSPLGPFDYQGVLIDFLKISTNHQAIIEHDGKTLLFYHDNVLPGGGDFRRSILMQELRYTPDGKMHRVNAD
jgi:hypothetical protein